MCLQTGVSFGWSSNVWGSWANGSTVYPTSAHLGPPRPTSPCCCVGMRGAVAWNRVADQTSVIKKHSTRPLVCVCVCVCVKGQRVGVVLRVLQAHFQPVFPKTHTHTQPPETAHAAYRLNTDCLALISPTRALHLITISVINNSKCGCMDWVLWQEKALLYHLWGLWLAGASDLSLFGHFFS